MSHQNPDPQVVRVSYQDLQGNDHTQTFELFAPPSVDAFLLHLADSYIERPEPGDWSKLAGLADQWFAAHLQLSIGTQGFQTQLSPWAFSAGHAIELYLKAAVAAHESIPKATAFGHKLSELWRHCESYDRFPLKGLLRADLLNLDRNIYSAEKRDSLQLDVRRHLSHNEILYLAIRHVQDLKYLGLSGKTVREDVQLSFGTAIPNKVMISQLGKIAQWTWGQWACRPGYNNASLYELANRLMGFESRGV